MSLTHHRNRLVCHPAGLIATLFVLLSMHVGFAAAKSGPAAPSVPPGGKVVSQAYDTQLKVTRTQLANGLVILSKEDHAAPVAYFGVFYKEH